MDRELAEQRAIVEALAEQQGVDPQAVVAERLPDPEAESDDESGDTEGDGTESSADSSAADAASGASAADSNDPAATND
jgi:hypothetical protein